ncbi:esterase/lipase family protein [Tautonia plasticadhaerens]|uniref:Alpha/beta hydrolase family protein n=1 Tax=Tautonia plasticadhaerens TaxID=2527974 RepID=A0A518GX06_9BACT|nr:alpha/beta fold hydrolase [Tautonia plasticadhaerens]QDV33126.1 Alpha/beta hydrolase family protein [Tautonia plasticadhaerens]
MPFVLATIAALSLSGDRVGAGWHPQSRGAEPTLTLRDPYRPGAIPVVLIHGMGSTARTWGPMIDRIKDDPVLATRYQFWTFSYDSCVALPLSAARFRSCLTRTRWALDPSGLDPALDRMVLVGQSQGGLIAKAAAQDGGWTLWDSTFSRRPEAIRCPPETRAELVDAFLTRRVPSVGRLVFIATPHHGSKGPAAATARLKEYLLTDRRQGELAGPIGEVVRLNGKEVLVPDLRRVPVGAVGGLAWDSPILDALNRIPIAPDVRRHSIIPQLGTPHHHLDTDGIVRYESSHLDEVDSEVIVPGGHVSLRRPEVAAEVARILRLHLAEQGVGVASPKAAFGRGAGPLPPASPARGISPPP